MLRLKVLRHTRLTNCCTLVTGPKNQLPLAAAAVVTAQETNCMDAAGLCRNIGEIGSSSSVEATAYVRIRLGTLPGDCKFALIQQVGRFAIAMAAAAKDASRHMVRRRVA
eukprot:TRINITY_DN41247_c0_g1_i1.p3 TRINITY_DN41247_c0_g1~~TRINITY_DN41247_c0_g1_i1.p3  ORF type:complete len:110 (-),score=17.02 TRINITY_DN41247_c0_g1_i1:99-428(-)